uniref:Uncharacterized protein n=1 Tax=Eutreptiella gymnastica TaxID=73025 RepID=A0A7S1HT59_9EUGL
MVDAELATPWYKSKIGLALALGVVAVTCLLKAASTSDSSSLSISLLLAKIQTPSMTTKVSQPRPNQYLQTLGSIGAATLVSMSPNSNAFAVAPEAPPSVVQGSQSTSIGMPQGMEAPSLNTLSSGVDQAVRVGVVTKGNRHVGSTYDPMIMMAFGVLFTALGALLTLRKPVKEEEYKFALEGVTVNMGVDSSVPDPFAGTATAFSNGSTSPVTSMNGGISMRKLTTSASLGAMSSPESSPSPEPSAKANVEPEREVQSTPTSKPTTMKQPNVEPATAKGIKMRKLTPTSPSVNASSSEANSKREPQAQTTAISEPASDPEPGESNVEPTSEEGEIVAESTSTVNSSPADDEETMSVGSNNDPNPGSKPKPKPEPKRKPRKPKGNPKITSKNFVLKDKARALKVRDVAKFIREAKAEGRVPEMENGGRIMLLLNSSMYVLSNSARNIVNLKTTPDPNWSLTEGLVFVLSDEAESLRDLMILEASFATDLLARNVGRKLTGKLAESLSPFTQRLPGLAQLAALRLPALLPTKDGKTTIIVEQPEVVLNSLAPELNPDEVAHVDALILLIREVFGDNMAAILNGDIITLQEAQQLVEALTQGTGTQWYTNVRDAIMGELTEALDGVRSLSDEDRSTALDFFRVVLDKVWDKVLVRAEVLKAKDDERRAASAASQS